jgi:hypothetical protein
MESVWRLAAAFGLVPGGFAQSAQHLQFGAGCGASRLLPSSRPISQVA